MLSLAVLASFTVLSSYVLAAPSPNARADVNLLSVEKFSGETSGRYIIRMKEKTTKANALDSLGDFKASSSSSKVTHEWDASFFNGFAGEFDESTLELLRANPDIMSISEDGVMHTMDFVTESEAPWGLERISQDGPLRSMNASALDFEYTYNDEGTGEGVDIYIIDTGIRTTHVEFGGRATWGATFGGYEDADGDGHGTHCAGIAGSAAYGVAKNVSLIAVKVLGDDGRGYTSDIISGIDWVRQQAASSGRPSVASMSLGGGTSTPIDDATTALIAAGVHVTVAAGNDNVLANTSSPARVADAITVGATAINDTMSDFSNYGTAVDIFAPGTDIISTWATGDTDTNMISGTSMATPYVAGLVAYYISILGNMSPSDMASTLKERAVANIVTGITSADEVDTPNLLARNDVC